jgi:hypothetical protein
MKMKKTAACVEPLESRIAPATIVTVEYVAGEKRLEISSGGDVGDTVNVEVVQLSKDTFRVRAVDSDTVLQFSGGSEMVSVLDFKAALNGLVFTGSDGDDQLRLSGLTGLRFFRFEGVTDPDTRVETQVDGSDRVELNNVTVTGDVSLRFGGTGEDFVTLGGSSVKVTGKLETVFGSDGGNLQVTAMDSVIGTLNVLGGAGADLVEVSGARANLTSEIVFSAGGGNNSLFVTPDVLSIGKSAVPARLNNAITFTSSGTGDDSLTVESAVSAVLGGAVQASLDGGANTVLLGGTSLKVGAAAGFSLIFEGGAGSDNLTLGALTAALSGGVRTTLGDGANSVTVSGTSTTLGSAAGVSWMYQGGQNADGISVTSGKFITGGALNLDGSGGTNTVQIFSQAVTVGRGTAGSTAGLAVNYVGTAGADTVRIGDTGSAVDLKGAVRMDAGAGTNQLVFSGVSVGVGAGLGVTAGVSLQYVGGQDADIVSTSGGRFTTAGALNVSGAGGSNTVQVFSQTAILGRGTAGETAGLAFNYVGEGGADTVRIGDAASAVDLKGALRMVPGAGTNQLVFSGATMSVGAGLAATAGVSLQYTGGQDADSVSFSGGRFTTAGALNVDGSGGSNTVQILSQAVTVGKGTAGGTAGLAMNYLGAGGADTVRIGDTGSTVDLKGAVKMEGGAGTNQLSFSGLSVGIGAGAVTTAGVSLQYTGGQDGDSISTSGARLTTVGALNVDGAAGANTLQILSQTLTLGKGTTGSTAGLSVNYVGAGGADAVRIGDAAGVNDLKGAVKVAAGDGANELRLRGISLKMAAGSRTDFGGSVQYTGGGGDDVLSVEAKTAVLSGSVFFVPGNGDNRMTLTGASLTVGKSAAAFTGETNPREISKSILYVANGSGQNLLSSDYKTLNLGGSVELLGTGFTGNSLSLAIQGDAVTIGKSAVLGRSVAVLGNSSNAASSGEVKLSGRSLTLTGDFQVEGIQNGVTVEMDSDRLSVAGAVRVTGGNGSDSVTIEADGSVAKASGIDLKGVDAIDLSPGLDAAALNVGFNAALGLNTVAFNFDAATALSNTALPFDAASLLVGFNASALNTIANSFDALNNVNTVQSQITLASHGLTTGDAVVYEPSAGTEIGGLDAGSVYYVVVVDANTVQLAATKAGATAVTPSIISLDSVGAGTQEFTSSDDRIGITAHGFESGDAVVYRPGAETEIGGLDAGVTYFVVKLDANTIKLAASKADATAVTPVTLDLTSAGTGSQNFFKSDDKLTVTGHGFATGDSVVYVPGAGTEVGGLDAGTVYYVVALDANTIQLASSKANAQALTPVVLDLSDAGTGTQSFVQVEDQIRILGHGLSTGDSLVYAPGAGGAIGGLSAGTVYYVVAVDADNIQLASSRLNATAGTPVVLDLTSAGSGTQELLETSDEITLSGHGFVTGDSVKYLPGAGSVIGGLSANAVYFVVVEDANTIKLASTKENAQAGVPVTLDLTSEGTGSQAFFRNDNALQIAGHGFETGQAVVYDPGAGGVIGGLTAGTVYYAIVDGVNSIRLAATVADALADTPVAMILTAAGTGNQEFLATSLPGQTVELLGKTGINGVALAGAGLTFRDALSVTIDGAEAEAARGQGVFQTGRSAEVVAALNALVDESVRIANVLVTKDTAVTLGEARSGVEIDNLNARAAFTLRTNGGGDTVLLERASLFGTSTIAGIAQILLGNGDDVVRIGVNGEVNVNPVAGVVNGRNNQVSFGAAVTLDGGLGNDSRNNIGNPTNLFKTGITPSETGVETVV